MIRARFRDHRHMAVRTELGSRMIGRVRTLSLQHRSRCRPRDASAPSATRRELVASPKSELPAALRHLQAGNIAPVDLAQAAIGPGMAVYTRYANVLDAEGKPVSVREALALIIRCSTRRSPTGRRLRRRERWALAWFEQGLRRRRIRRRRVLSKAKVPRRRGMAERFSSLKARQGAAEKPEELPPRLEPCDRPAPSAWEVVHHLIPRAGERRRKRCGRPRRPAGARAETARELAYRLVRVCERKKRSREALAYNGLVAKLAGNRTPRAGKRRAAASAG